MTDALIFFPPNDKATRDEPFHYPYPIFQC